MNKTISTRIAANDKILILEQKTFIEKLAIALIIITTILSYLGIALQTALISTLLIIYFYKKDLKEIKRMRNTYAI